MEAELRNLVGKYDVLFLTEIKNRVTDNFNFAGYDTYTINNYRQGKGGAGGVAIIIRKNIRCRVFEVDQCNGIWDAIDIRIECDKLPINFIYVYRRPEIFPGNIRWANLFENINGNEGLVLLGDFNAHHISWNCERSDMVGVRLLEEIKERAFICDK